MTSPRLGLTTLTLACGMLCAAPAPAGQPETRVSQAQVDSLVWDIEGLEADLRLCEIRGKATADSLSLRLEFMGQRLDWAMSERPRWYEKPGLAFLCGAILATIAVGQIVKITF